MVFDRQPRKDSLTPTLRRNQSDRSAHRGTWTVDENGLTTDPHLTGQCAAVEPEEGAYQLRLARSQCAKNAQHLASVKIEAHGPNGHTSIVVARHMPVADGQDGFL